MRLPAQGLVENGSFETIDLTVLPPPSWGPGPSTPSEIEISTSPHLFGCQGWYTRLNSPDIFWGPTHVPNNYMTAPRSSGTPAFDGSNYAGIATGRVGSTFKTEYLAGRLLSSPSPGLYEVRARFAMGSYYNRPGKVRVSLVGPSTSIVAGEMLVGSTAWTLFSQYVTVPPGTYDRIMFEGVDYSPNALQAYIFIDSVDVVPARSACSYLGARLSKKQSPPGECCYDLVIDNTLPTSLGTVTYVRVNTTAPVTITGAAANPGWIIAPPPPTATQATWGSATTGGPIPAGSSLYAGSYCIIPNGVTPQRHVIEFIGSNSQVICRDTIWTDCDAQTPPCMNMYAPSIACETPDASGNQRYRISFAVSPFAGTFPTGSNIRLRSSQGTLSPAVIPVGPGTTVVGPIIFTDTPPTDSVVCIIGDLHVTWGERDTIICSDTLCITLPDCPKECCTNFTKQIRNWSIKAVNGNVTFTACVVGGPAQIKRFSATIVSAQTRTRCIIPPILLGLSGWYHAFGDIEGGSLSSTLAGPTFAGRAYSREIVWGGSGSPICADFSGCIPLKLNMTFPDPPTDPNCIDSLSVTIRFSFTDCNCVTCDTVITFTGPRKYVKLPTKVDPRTGGTPRTYDGPVADIGHSIALPDPGLLRIDMSSDDDGQLLVTLPESDPEATAIRFTGMTITPLGTGIAGVTNHASLEAADISGNTATAALSLDAGHSAVFDLSYLNSERTPVIDNYVRFRYEIVGDEEHTQYETDDILVQARTPGATDGDDISEESSPEVSDVRTYVLHLDADNNAAENVGSIRIHVSGSGTQLIAVGPVGNGTDATIHSGSDADGNAVVQIDKSTWEVHPIEAGSSLTPIYLTFAGAASGATIDYETVNESGSVLTSSSLSLGSPLRTAGVGSDVASQETSLWPVYPNPTGSSATIGFRMQTSGKVMLTVRDMQGREVLRKVDGERFGAGDHLVPMMTTSLTSGTYIVVLEVDGQTYTRTLTVVR